MFPTKRLFSTSFHARGIYKNFIQKIAVGVSEISSNELSQKLSQDPIHGIPASVHILDVRETYEWNEDKIPYALYTGRGNLERDIEGIVPNLDDEVILYCAGGFRSMIAANSLQTMGYTNVKSLKGGIGGWKIEGHPIITNTSTYSERLDYGNE